MPGLSCDYYLTTFTYKIRLAYKRSKLYQKSRRPSSRLPSVMFRGKPCTKQKAAGMENGKTTLKGLGQLMFWRKRRKNNQSFLF